MEERMVLDKERIAVPELLFNPSDIGLNQMNPMGILNDSLKSIHSDLRDYFLENICLGGGNTLFRNYQERMYIYGIE